MLFFNEVVWTLDRTEFRAVMATAAQEATEEQISRLHKVEMFSQLTKNELTSIEQSLELKHYSKGMLAFFDLYFWIF